MVIFDKVSRSKNILVAPLNWGIGHATRCVPIINKQLSNGHNVVLCASGGAKKFLQQEFPNLQIVELKGFNISYTYKFLMPIWLLLQMPFFYLSFFIEKHRVRKIIKQYKIHTIISDNRYGVRNKNTKNIIITHQLFIQLPMLLKVFQKSVHFFTRLLLNKFDECWIPDYQQLKFSLAGNLSHGKKMPKNYKYIGPLSRFSDFISYNAISLNKIPNVLVLISGPEPQRRYFKKQMEKRFANSSLKVLILCGKPNSNTSQKLGDFSDSPLQILSHLSTQILFNILKTKPKLISRSGYSSIMDFDALKLDAEFIPTPGQPEQKYLKQWMEQKVYAIQA